MSQESVDRYYDKIATRWERLSPEEEQALGYKIQNEGCKLSLDKLVCSNLRLVVTIAREYEGRGLDIMDLISDGNTGLLAAAKKYDPAFPTIFGTYAGWYIRRAIQTGIMKGGRCVRLPFHTYQKIMIVRKISARLEREIEHPPSAEDIAEEVGWPVSKIRLIQKWDQSTLSLDHKINQYDNETMMDLLPSDAKTPDEELEIKNNSELLHEAIEQLNDRHKAIILRYYGIGYDTTASSGDLSREWSISSQAIIQGRDKALQRLRKIITILQARKFQTQLTDDDTIRNK